MFISSDFFRHLIPVTIGTLLLVLFAMSGCVSAQVVEQRSVTHAAPDGSGPVTVTLFAAPCAAAQVLDQIPPDLHTLFYAGEATYDGAKHKFCWSVEISKGVELLEGYLFLLDEHGNTGFYPLSDFKGDVGA